MYYGNTGLKLDEGDETIPETPKDYIVNVFQPAYTRGDTPLLPTNDEDLETFYNSAERLEVATADDSRISQTATGEYAIHQFKGDAEESPSATISWEGQSDVAPSSATVYLQIYNQSSEEWEAIDSDSLSSAATDFELSGTVSDLTDYKDANNVVSFRVYQYGTVTFATDYWEVDFTELSDDFWWHLLMY